MENQEKTVHSGRLGGLSSFLHRNGWILLALIFLAAAGIAYGNYTRKYLIFDTILITEGNDEYEEREPMLMITTQASELPQLESNVLESIHPILNRVNFERYFLITVFQGFKYNLGFGAEIQRITLSGKEITVNAHFVTPVPGRGAANAVCSPHHIVKVRKGHLTGTYRVVLQVDGQYLLEENVTFP
jgi:hypothetical protein